MTPDLEKALARAKKSNLRVVAVGRAKANGQAVYCVPSVSQPNRLHMVWAEEGHLRCDCLGCVHGRLCMHRAIVWAYLQQLAEELRQAQEAADKAMRQKRERSGKAVNNRPVSMFK